MEAKINGTTYALGSSASYRPLHAAMVAAGLVEVDIHVDGARFSALSIERVAKCAGIVVSMGGHEDGR